MFTIRYLKLKEREDGNGYHASVMVYHKISREARKIIDLDQIQIHIGSLEGARHIARKWRCEKIILEKRK